MLARFTPRFPGWVDAARTAAAGALALAVFSVFAGTAVAQPGVWTTIPVPGVGVYGIAAGDSASVLLAGNIGAFRFDGLRMTRLPIFSPDADSIRGNSILRASNGDVWFGTATHGVFRLAAQTGTVTRFTAADGVGNNVSDDALCLAEAGDGTIWVGTRLGGLSRYDGAAWTTLTPDVGLPSVTVNALATDPRDGSIWAACAPGAGVEGGLVHIENGFPVVFRGLTNDQNAQEAVTSVTVTRAGRVWIGFAGGVAEWTGSGYREFPSGGVTVFQAIARGAHGELWLGTGNRGIARFDDDALTIFPSGPPSTDIRAVFADPAGVLWVGTSAGLGRFEGASWLSYRNGAGLPAQAQVFSAARDLGAIARGDSIDVYGSTWFGMSATQTSLTDFWTLSRRANGRVYDYGTPNGLPRGTITALVLADSGQVWMSTISNPAGGATRFDQAGQVRDTIRIAQGLPSADITSLARDGGVLWVGTLRGISRWDEAAHLLSSPVVGPGAIPDAPIRGVAVDAQHRVWMATGTNPIGSDARPPLGAALYDPLDPGVVTLTTANGLPTNTLNSVTVFGNGDVWFGSVAGAIRLRGGEVGGAIDVFSVAQGLPATQVNAIAEGPNGEAWVATPAGLALFDGANWTSFNVGDGLSAANVTNVFADAEGVLASLRGEGVSMFHPDRTAPRAEVVTGPPAATGARDVQFGLRGGDLDSGVRNLSLSYQMDGGIATPFVEDVPPPSFSLADGDHEFRLWAKDRTLNPSVEPFVWRFTVDATPPRPIVQQPVFNAIVSGTVAVLGNVSDPRFAEYTVEARQEGTVRWDTLLVSNGIPAFGEPLYLWDTTAGADGDWELRVGSRDDLGLIGYVQVTVIVDNLSPNASVTSPARVDHTLGGHVFTTNGEVELAVPPNAFSADQIVRIEPLETPATLPAPYAGATWSSGWRLLATQPTLAKPATLTFKLPGVPADARVGVFHFAVAGPDTVVTPVGGARSADGTTISTTVSDLGPYAVLYGAGVGTTSASFDGARALDCQPRVLSPRGGGFDTKLSISFDLGKAQKGAVKVFDRAGRLVKEVVEDGDFAPGRNVVFWDGTNGSGEVVASGLYVVAVRFDQKTTTASIVVANR